MLENQITKSILQNQLLMKMVFFQTTTTPGKNETENLNNEMNRIITEEVQFTEVYYPFTIKPNIATLGSIIEVSRQEPLISFLPFYIIRNLLGLNASTKFEEYSLSPSPVDKILNDKIFLETDIAQGMDFQGKRSGVIHN